MGLGPLAYGWISREVVSSLLRNGVKRDEAKDLVQEAFARLLESPARVENPEGFVRAVARNLWIDEVRRGRMRVAMRPTVEALYGETCDSRDAFRLWSAAEAVQDLLAALDNMPRRRREIWRGARLFNESHKSLAEHHGIAVKSIEKTLSVADREIAAIPGYEDWPCLGSDAHLSLDGSCRIESESIEPS